MKLLHNPEVKKITFLDERYYQDREGNYFPSATTVLDVYPKGYGFTKWLKDLGSNADQVLKDAGEQGTLIHNTIEAFFRGEEITWADEKGKAKYTEEQWKMLMRFVDFYKTYKPEPLGIEYSLVDKELGFGGTIDFVGTVNKQLWLIDWKSSNGVYRSYELQVAAYFELWNKQMPKYKLDRYGILHLKALTRGESKNGTIQGKGWKLHESADPQDKLYNFFEMTKAIWHKENPNAKPKTIEYPDRFSIKSLQLENDSQS